LILLLSVLAILLAYLLGSISFSYMVCRRARGIDIRDIGSRNPGAANTFRQAGPLAGLAVLLADMAKGAVAVTPHALFDAPEWAVFLSAVAVLAGHNWPVFLGFRGGKGAATVLGISFAMLPMMTAVATAPAAIVIVMSRNVVLGGAVGFLLLNALTIGTRQPGSLIALCLLLSAIIVATHLAGSWSHYMEAIRTRQWGVMLWVE
jgi:glycerol-3-phosphate acyltransferase PlsY